MTITSKLRRVIDRKQWEMLPVAPNALGNGSCMVHDCYNPNKIYYVRVANEIYHYDATQDSFMSGYNSPITAVAPVGAVHHPFGPSGTAVTGSVSSLRTNLPFALDLSGYKVRIIGGPASGEESTITGNVIGSSVYVSATSGTIYFDPPFSTAITNQSQYLLMTGRLYVLGGVTGTNNFRYYETATDTWSAQLGTTNIDATVTAHGKFVETQSPWMTFLTSSVTTATVSSVTTTGPNWETNQFRDQQIRILSGTGKGQWRNILSNTADTITVSPNWTITPDNTSQYVIEGNDDYIYQIRAGTLTIYRYSITANTWQRIGAGLEIVPSVVRAATPSVAMGDWVTHVTDPDWNIENSLLNGRYIYSLRANTSNGFDRYDIGQRKWEVVPYIYNGETYGGGTHMAYDGADHIYIQKDATGRFFKFNIYKYFLGPFATLQYPQSAQNASPTFFIKYTDGETLTWMYTMAENTTVPFRMLVF